MVVMLTQNPHSFERHYMKNLKSLLVFLVAVIVFVSITICLPRDWVYVTEDEKENVFGKTLIQAYPVTDAFTGVMLSKETLKESRFINFVVANQLYDKSKYLDVKVKIENKQGKSEFHVFRKEGIVKVTGLWGKTRKATAFKLMDSCDQLLSLSRRAIKANESIISYVKATKKEKEAIHFMTTFQFNHLKSF